MRQDLQAAWDSAKKTDPLNRHPSKDEIESALDADEKVLRVIKGSIVPGRLDSMKDAKWAQICTVVLTSKRLHYFGRGMMKNVTNSHEIVEFRTITGVELRKNFSFGQMIHISRAANSDTVAQVHLEETKLLQSDLKALMESSSQVTQAPAAATLDPLDQLKKLKDLLDAGIISQDEFEDKKRILLGQI